MECKTKFNVFQMVRIKAIETTAQIIEIIFVNTGGVTYFYKMEYWLNGEIKTVGLYEWEIE